MYLWVRRKQRYVLWGTSCLSWISESHVFNTNLSHLANCDPLADHYAQQCFLCIILRCCSCCVTGQHYTPRGKCCLLSSPYVISQMATISLCNADWRGECVCHPSHPQSKANFVVLGSQSWNICCIVRIGISWCGWTLLLRHMGARSILFSTIIFKSHARSCLNVISISNLMIMLSW